MAAAEADRSSMWPGKAGAGAAPALAGLPISGSAADASVGGIIEGQPVPDGDGRAAAGAAGAESTALAGGHETSEETSQEGSEGMLVRPEVAPEDERTRELYFLVAEFLRSGPCTGAAAALQQEMAQNGLGLRRKDWLGASHALSHAQAAAARPDVGAGRLPAALERLVELASEAYPVAPASKVSVSPSRSAALADRAPPRPAKRSQLPACSVSAWLVPLLPSSASCQRLLGLPYAKTSSFDRRVAAPVHGVPLRRHFWAPAPTLSFGSLQVRAGVQRRAALHLPLVAWACRAVGGRPKGHTDSPRAGTFVPGRPRIAMAPSEISSATDSPPHRLDQYRYGTLPGAPVLTGASASLCGHP